MRYATRLCVSVLFSALLLGAVVPAIAQQIRFYPDFSSPVAAEHLRLNGNSTLGTWQSQTVLRLTNGAAQAEQSSAWFNIQQPITQGFTTWFTFQAHAPIVCCAPGDGIAFVIQNTNATDSTQGASGMGITAMGAANGGMGYSGLNNSLAVEFDLYGDPWDPNSNHIAVQTCGGTPSQFNSPVHEPGSYTIGNNHNVTSCLLSSQAINANVSQLGPSCNGDSCTDGPPNQVVIQYTPPASGQQMGMLEVWLNPPFVPGTHTPIPGTPAVINVPYNIVYSAGNPTGLSPANSKGTFFVGFTGSQPDPGLEIGTSTAQDVSAWTFTTHSPVQVTQIIPPGTVEANYVFGGHQMGVNYPAGFTNPDNITMTVLETPTNQETFYQQRLLGTPFADESCIIYLETGGNCVVYSVTCQDQNGNNVTCPTEPPPNNPIAICTKFYNDPPPASELAADFLSADPIGSNNWCSIFTGISDNNDTVVSGKGTGFSDLVATFSSDGQGPACGGGSNQSLKQVTKSIEKDLKPVRPPQSDFCPAIGD